MVFYSTVLCYDGRGGGFRSGGISTVHYGIIIITIRYNYLIYAKDVKYNVPRKKGTTGGMDQKWYQVKVKLLN